MATKSKDKTKIITRKRWGRLSDDIKDKIVGEIKLVASLARNRGGTFRLFLTFGGGF